MPKIPWVQIPILPFINCGNVCEIYTYIWREREREREREVEIFILRN